MTENIKYDNITHKKRGDTMEEFLKIIESNKEYFNYPPYLQTLLINSEIKIHYLDELKHLKTINILGENTDYQKQIIDYSEINRFSELEVLRIESNKNIKSLDINNLTELHTLILIDNINLETVIGLENLKKLKIIIIVGNKVKSIDNIEQFIDNTKNAKMIKFDVNMYHYLKESDIINAINNNIEYAEKISVGQLYNLTFEMMQELYEKGKEITKKINTNNKKEIAKEIYKYLVKTLKYDYETLDMRNKYIQEGNIIKVFKNKYKDINSSYKALIENKAVCEGYANAFKFLANMKQIEAENIVCFLNKTNAPFEYYNHTASRFKIDGEWLYCDSQIDDENLKYFALTREKFEESHKLQPELTRRVEENEKDTEQAIYKKKYR